MDKFWNWMREKKYAGYNAYTKIYFLYSSPNVCRPNKQMLIGYMIEYCQENAYDIYTFLENIYFEDIETFYNELENNIKRFNEE